MISSSEALTPETPMAPITTPSTSTGSAALEEGERTGRGEERECARC